MTPWTAACQAFLSITNSQDLLKLMSIESVMPSNHLILCQPLLLLPSIFPSIRVFSNNSVLCISGPKYWSSSFSISPSNVAILWGGGLFIKLQPRYAPSALETNFHIFMFSWLPVCCCCYYFKASIQLERECLGQGKLKHEILQFLV